MKKRRKLQPNQPQVHDLIDFVRSASEDIDREYRYIQKRVIEDPGTAGDRGEESWAQLLRNWLPPTYQIVTKGRILGEGGLTSPQVDVVILHPHYPHGLLSKKLYLAGGVIAAFECKTTLRKEHIYAAVETGALIRRLIPVRTGSPYKELFSPICYGLLAHSQSWKRDPENQIRKHLSKADENFVKHPRETLDYLCVADLALWQNVRIPPSYSSNINGISQYKDPYDGNNTITSYMLGFSEIPPVGMLIARILRRIAWEDASLRNIADYFFRSGMKNDHAQGPRRNWDETIYTEGTNSSLKSGVQLIGSHWDEWSARSFFY